MSNIWGALQKGSSFAEPNLFALIQSLGWVYRFLNILNTPIPDVDITHSAAAAFCGIPCVLAKIKNKTPFILTEHGVYLREQYFALSQRGYSSYLSTFLIRLIHSVTSVNYYYADQVSPVCNYNTRWEKEFGVNEKNIKVIYNGVDKNIFQPTESTNRNKYPTVVTVARIDPIKDIKSMILAADIVRKTIKDIRFIVYGSVTVASYYEECLKLVKELKIEENFIFAGHTNDTPAAYRSGDIIALSSISEAFPYSVVEAMLVGKPVIATDVGGIREAIGDCGILIEPRNPEDMAAAVTKLIKDPELLAEMGENGRNRALNLFTLDKVMEKYNRAYTNLFTWSEEAAAVHMLMYKNRLFFEKGFAFFENGYYEEAIHQFKRAIRTGAPEHIAAVILTYIADSYNRLGQKDHALFELKKAEIITSMPLKDKVI